jgi:2-polyprenyl-3-methyl-5-hydroxy-6-metoxy-1,4-benzoquinol methylase
LAHSGLTDQVFQCAPGQWNLFRCDDCASAYLDPRPTLASIGLAYSSYYTHTPIETGKTGDGSWWRRWRLAQRNGFLNKHYGYHLKPAANFSLFLSQRRQRRFDRYTGYLRYPGPESRVLDIGCGNGSFLAQMQSLGWKVCGIEPDPRAVEQAQKAGLDVRAELSPKGLWPDGHFDAITMSHVMEHLHDPVQHLAECWKLLKPGGQLMIATPNYDAIGRNHFGSDWRGLEIPRHLVIFTEKSLWLAMKQSGFEVVRPKRPNLNALNMFRMSAKLCRQRTGKPGPSGLKLKWLAMKADQAVKADPSRTEELILLGTKI